MRRALTLELALLLVVLGAQAYLFSRLVHSAASYDEDVYLAAVDALRHGQSLGSQVFAAQFPGFYDLLRGLSYVAGIGVARLRWALLCVTLLGTVGAWLAGRRFGGPVGGLLAASLLVIAPPLDLFGYQVLADPPELALAALSLGLATLGGVPAAVAAGAAFGAAGAVKVTAVTALPALVWLLRGRLVPAAAGFAVVVGAVLLAHAPALGSLWASGVTYHEKARSTPAVLPHPYRAILDQIPRGTPFFVLGLLAIVVAVAFLVSQRELPGWPLWTWTVLAVAFLFVHQPLHSNHLIEFPFTLAIAAGATVGAALRRVPVAVTAAVGLAVVAGYVQQLHRVDVAKTPEPPGNVAAARALARLTPPGSLTVDDRPIISFLARRRVVGQLVDLARLRWETGSLTDARVIRDLAPARAVVVSRALREHPAVLAYLRAHFERRYDRGGIEIWVRPT
ncbi:MAG TPA: hypothetical protein VHC67_10095 [Gaiellaceae bacterium]|nr:hypothetical protein [Gaiellaceae bacterium]